MSNTLSIEEGNKLIMFFDGAENEIIDIMDKPTNSIKYKASYYPEWRLPRFNEDWNLLMPIVEKINNLAIDGQGEMGVWISPHKCAIGENEHDEIKSNESYQVPLIRLVWNTIVQFIQWYNTTKKP